MYDANDKYDTGETYSSAEEMHVKMISRQVLLPAADGKEHDFNQIDNQFLCANKTKDKYERIEKKMIIGNDIGPLNAGPLWIWTPLKYDLGKDSQGKSIVTVHSPTLRTPNNYPVSTVASFHYCKLLSPARAFEWIYVDSLKP